MTDLRPSRLSGDALPKVALTGLVLAIAAFAIGGFALFRVSVVSGQKADRADERSQAAQRIAALSVCALADAQRIGKPDAPPPTTDRAIYTATAWQATFSSLGCNRFTQVELNSVVKTPSPKPTPKPTVPPTVTPTLPVTPSPAPTTNPPPPAPSPTP